MICNLDAFVFVTCSHICLVIRTQWGALTRLDEILDGCMELEEEKLERPMTFSTRKPVEGPDEGVYLVIVRRSPVGKPFAPRGVLASLTAVLRPPLTGWPGSSECRIYFLPTSRSVGELYCVVVCIWWSPLVFLGTASSSTRIHSWMAIPAIAGICGWSALGVFIFLVCCFMLIVFAQHAYERIRSPRQLQA